MAKTLNEIKMDYKKAKDAADRLEALAKKLRQVEGDQFEDTIHELKKNWKGENADAYVEKARILQRKMDGTKEDLGRAAKTIREIAQRTYDAEMQAYRVVSTRSYSGGGSGGGGRGF